MTITKTALAAAILAVMAVSAQAQQGPTRQIQVLPAPGAVAQVAEQAPAKVDGEAPAAEAPAAEAAPEAAPQVAAPVVAPKFAPKKVLVAAPIEAKPEPKFVEPKFVPVRKASYGHGYGKRNCH